MNRTLAFVSGVAATACLAPWCPAPSLIELETVNAIQGELVTTAVPNYMQALDRTRVNTVKADFQTLSHALEQYQAEFGAFPVCTRMSSQYGPAPGNDRFQNIFAFPNTFTGGPGNLTYPSPYMSSVPVDQYSNGVGADLPYAYFVDRQTNTWLLHSPGPDNDYDIEPLRDFDRGNSAYQQRIFNPDDPNDNDGDLILSNRR